MNLSERAIRLVKLNGLAARIERRIVPNGLLEDFSATDTIDPKSLTIIDKYMTVLEVIRKECGDDKAASPQSEDLLEKFRTFLESLKNGSEEMKDEQYGDIARINSRAEALELEAT